MSPNNCKATAFISLISLAALSPFAVPYCAQTGYERPSRNVTVYLSPGGKTLCEPLERHSDEQTKPFYPSHTQTFTTTTSSGTALGGTATTTTL